MTNFTVRSQTAAKTYSLDPCQNMWTVWWDISNNGSHNLCYWHCVQKQSEKHSEMRLRDTVWNSVCVCGQQIKGDVLRKWAHGCPSVCVCVCGCKQSTAGWTEQAMSKRVSVWWEYKPLYMHVCHQMTEQLNTCAWSRGEYKLKYTYYVKGLLNLKS